MPHFRFKAYDHAGKTVSGDVEAAGVRDATERLRTDGLYPVEVAESAGKAGFLTKARGGKIGVELTAHTTRQLATLISTGTNLAESLGVLAENAGNPALIKILVDVRERVVEGSSLASALGAHPAVFSPFYRGLVASGEESGALSAVLARLADHLETRARVTRELWTALTYPILMTLVGAGVLGFLFIFVIPKITRIFEDTASELPLATVFLIGITEILRTYWPVLLVIVGGGIFASARYREDPRVKALWDRVLLKLPVVSPLASAFLVANMTRTLGSLLRAGVPLLKAVELTKEVLNDTVYNQVLDRATEDLTGGGSLSASLGRSGAVPPLLTHMTGVGERGGNLDEMLLKAADTYDNEFEAGLKRVTALAEPLLVLVMGLVVGFIVLAILLPIFELNQVVG